MLLLEEEGLIEADAPGAKRDPDRAQASINGQVGQNVIMRVVSFIYRFIVLLLIVAYREGNRDA